MKISIDTSEVRAAIADMRMVDQRMVRWVRPVVERGALAVKDDLQDQMRKSRHFKGAARGISYDMVDGGFGDTGVFAAEIGPTKGSPGSLGNIAYFGTSKGGGTVEDPESALERELPKFESALADLGEKLVFG